jgi:NADPH:quinone reductase-like Zn-dependent oxidoreductase
LGLDVAGVVEGLGPDVRGFKVGDAVFGDLSLTRLGQGAFAEYVCDREGMFSAIPDGLGFEDAATLPHSAILALQGLRRRDGRTFGPGARVLIEGASGNVGPFAVQIAKARGAEVTGVCSPAKVDFVRSLGADHVIDYRSVDYTRSGSRYDWICAVDAHHSLLASRRALAPGGVFVALGGSTAWMLSSILMTPAIALTSDRRAGMMIWWQPFAPADVARLKELVAVGSIRPHVDRRYPLDDVVAALRHVDEGQALGKVIVVP